jgi:hypothetical protein
VPGLRAEQFLRTWPWLPVSTLICPIFTMETPNWSKKSRWLGALVENGPLVSVGNGL